MMTRRFVALATAALTLASASATFAQGAPKSDKGKGGAMHGKMTGKGKTAAAAVYACTRCRQYYTPAQAKKMGYKDPMGHTLTRMAKAPAGFTPGGKMTGGKAMKGKM